MSARSFSLFALFFGLSLLADAAPAPLITSLNPASASVGLANVNLTITGANFVPGAAVRWNAALLAATYIGSGQLSVVIPGNFLTAAGIALVTVVNPDASTSQAVPFTISPPALAITTASLPAGIVGVPYSATLTATGGVAPYVWATSDALAAGLSLSADGTLAGIPSTAGTFTFTVRVVDRSQAVAFQSFSAAITAPQLTITTASPLPDATVAVPYSQVFSVSGGTAPYRWSISGQVPDGLKLDTDRGTLSGTPPSRGTYAFNLQATDGTGANATKSFTLTVKPPPLAITTEAPLFDGTVGSFYSQAFFASGGVPPYKWAIASGQPPAGLAFDANTGALAGTPTATGTSAFTIQVTDSLGKAVTKPFTVTVALPKLTIITPSQLADGAVGTAYLQKFLATGGTPPYAWTFSAGNVPGLRLNSATGVLSDTPTAAGDFSFTIQVRDSAGTTADRNFTLHIDPAPLTLTSDAQLPDGAIAMPYSYTLAASGGVPPYTWSANGLPKGLLIDPSSGSISGTPEAAGQLVFTVRVTDKARTFVTALFRISISLPPMPSLRISGLSGTANPADQKVLAVSLGSPYPIAITGQLTLSFASDVGAGDSTIQFSTGGRTIDFTIASGSLDAVFSAPVVAVQTGTVAGTISVSAQLQAGGVDMTPSPAPVATANVDRAAPVVKTAKLVRGTNGFSIQTIGFATSREVTQATFRFKVAPGSSLSQSEITVPIESLFGTWYQDAGSSRFGSQFTYTQPFTIQGDANAITPDSVTLTNRLGSTTVPIQ